MAKAAFVGVCACAYFYILVGIMGYCLIDGIVANFLEVFDTHFHEKPNAPLFYIANAGFLVSVTFSFPIMFFGARNNFIAIANTIKLVLIRNKE
jgi:hypothetical protein